VNPKEKDNTTRKRARWREKKITEIQLWALRSVGQWVAELVFYEPKFH